MEAKTVADVLGSLTESERRVLVESINEARKRIGRGKFHELAGEIRTSLEQHIK